MLKVELLLYPRYFQWGREGGYIVSPLSVHTSCMSVTSVCTKNGFHSISFEKICAFDSYYIHQYVIIKQRSIRFRVKFTNYYMYGSYGPFSTLKNSFSLIAFEKIIGFIFYTQVCNHKI